MVSSYPAIYRLGLSFGFTRLYFLAMLGGGSRIQDVMAGLGGYNNTKSEHLSELLKSGHINCVGSGRSKRFELSPSGRKVLESLNASILEGLANDKTHEDGEL